MSKLIKLSIFVLLIIFIICFFSYRHGISLSVNKNGDDVLFVISKGEGVKQIAENLLNENLIKSKFYFEIYIWRTKNQLNIKAGDRKSVV